MEIILASQSPYRKQQLETLGLNFKTVPSSVDEDVFKSKIADPVELASTLAEEKAKSVLANNPDAIVIGSDQVASVNGEIFSKPGSLENNLEHLQKLIGKTHQLTTSVCVLKGTEKKVHTSITKLTMKTLNRDTLSKYILLDQPYDCAGGYKIESLGLSLFSNIESDDFTGIIGLPLIKVSQFLQDFTGQLPFEN